MRRRSERGRALVLAVVAAIAGPAWAQGVRVVDSVVVNQPGDEAAHHLAGAGTSTGTSAGRTWRGATGWFSYSLRTYDDSPLALVCVLADGDPAGESFDILVDGRKTARVTRDAGKAGAATLEVKVAFEDTMGKTAVVVTLAAHPGSRTARVLELRSMQEHLE